MTVSDVGRKLTQEFEGLKLNAYQDVAGSGLSAMAYQGVKEAIPSLKGKQLPSIISIPRWLKTP